jgi:hypothetical protein
MKKIILKNLKTLIKIYAKYFIILLTLNDNCFNIWKYKNQIGNLRTQKTELLTNHSFIKKFDDYSKSYSKKKICFYCNYEVPKFCEYSGHFIYTI